ncbi:Lysophospholipase, alpha-beta hydrolase superfamily [Gracilibacillus ureilyticus]|uniref:Lysophospholipase, alpha-beta hydrolase superfamily n=1 Tax=Gracilibacillus ureilyticus TaxID=531814 RepID=A0A1H9S4K9_9BACI|nr:alpha/beta hydrolase [Gracilibacillus ureilyticus]SER79937.1 Lysophospholipase, alpha-beta hydrolase superfamily [Gracilibacillus ureilyticus]
MVKSLWLDMSDKTPVYLRIWDKVSHPRAIVQIAHGMAEHIERYDEFAEFLNSNKIVVCGNDHRGHGQTGTKQNRMGYFGNSDGFDRTVSDLIEVTDYLQKKFPGLPIILLGHSMGSFLARRYLTLNNSFPLSGMILIGTGYQSPALIKAGKMLVKTISTIKGKTAEGKFVNKLTFNQYNKKTENETEFDWISNNKETVKNYIDDPSCGFIPTNHFFHDLYDGIEKVQRKKDIMRINKQIPLLFLSGDSDPVTNYGKGMKQVVQMYHSINIKEMDQKIYPNMRHEIINENNKETVYRDILGWIDKQITCQSVKQSL